MNDKCCPHEDDFTKIKEQLATGDGVFKLMENEFNHIKSYLARIEKQTTATNGRVNKLEKWRAWLAGIVIGIGVINTPVVLFALGYLIKSYLK